MNEIIVPLNGKAGTTRRLDEYLLHELDAVLATIEARVLVPADDIGPEQVRQIGRELMLMRLHVDEAYKKAGVPKVERSFHLMRESEWSDGEPEGGRAA